MSREATMLSMAPRGSVVVVAAGERQHQTHIRARSARPGTTDEIAVAALFLADPENSYMTGHVLVVAGGWTAGYARDF